MGSHRKCITATLATFVAALSLACILLAFFINYDWDNNANLCLIGPEGSEVNSWLCYFVYAVAGTSFLCLTILGCFAAGKLWYRGGIYKFLQLLALAVPAVLWGVTSGYVTKYGIEANDQTTVFQGEDFNVDKGADESMRIALMACSISACVLCTLGVLLRAVEKPGKIRQDDLDEMVAEARAKRAIAYYQRHYGQAMVRDLGGREQLLRELTADEIANLREQNKYGTGCIPDGSAPDDEIYVPRHPRWYGKWLLPAEVDLRRAPWMPSVLDQGKLGTCTAHAAANAYRFALVKEARQEKAFKPSCIFIYYNTRRDFWNEYGEVDYKGGISIRAAFLTVKKHGVCEEKYCPYTDNLAALRGRAPSTAAIANAEQHKKKLKPIKLFGPTKRGTDGAQHLLVDSYEKIYTLEAALARGHPLACALTFLEPLLHGRRCMLRRPTNEEWRQRNNNKLWSHHAVLLVGYNRSGGYFIFQNSWGTDSNDRGYFYAPYDFIADTRLSCDFWMFND